MEELMHMVTHLTGLEQTLLVFAAGGGLALTTGLFGAWIGAYFGGRRGARREIARMQQQQALPSGLVEVQLSELRQAVETMAVEMERISEGQRFTARMLVERVGAPSQLSHRRDGTAITPH